MSHHPQDPSKIPSPTTNEFGRVRVALTALVRLTDGRVEVLVALRHADAEILAGMWELPGGKIEEGESPLQAAARELREELHIDCSGASCTWMDLGELDPPAPVGRPAPTFSLFAVELPRGAVPRSAAAQAIAWVDLATLSKMRWPATNESVIAAVVSALASRSK